MKDFITIILLTVSVVSSVFFFENRYAKEKEVKQNLFALQNELQRQQVIIMNLQLQFIALLDSLPPKVRDKIISTTTK